MYRYANSKVAPPKLDYICYSKTHFVLPGNVAQSTVCKIYYLTSVHGFRVRNPSGHTNLVQIDHDMDRVKRIWYLSPMRAAKVQASLRIRAVSPEPPLLAHTSSESGGTFRQKARSLAPLNGWVCAVKICHDGMLEDTNSLDGAHIISTAVLSQPLI